MSLEINKQELLQCLKKLAENDAFWEETPIELLERLTDCMEESVNLLKGGK